MVLPLQAQLLLEAFSDRIWDSLKWASAFILDQSPTTLQNYMLSSLGYKRLWMRAFLFVTSGLSRTQVL